MKYTTEEIFDLVNKHRQEDSRDVVLANIENPREVYKDRNIKIQKYISREDREEGDDLISSLGSASQEVSPEGLKGLLSQEEEVSVISEPAISSSSDDEMLGISMQHAKTKSGIKLFVTYQTQGNLNEGGWVELTAELKRHSRLRELKKYESDSYEFSNLYFETIKDLKSLSPEQGKNVAMGRLHDRGIRDLWYRDMMVVATLDHDEIIRQAVIHLNDKEYEIILNDELSPHQKKLFHSTGILGNLQTHRQAPSFKSAKLTKFK